MPGVKWKSIQFDTLKFCRTWIRQNWWTFGIGKDAKPLELTRLALKNLFQHKRRGLKARTDRLTLIPSSSLKEPSSLKKFIWGTLLAWFTDPASWRLVGLTSTSWNSDLGNFALLEILSTMMIIFIITQPITLYIHTLKIETEMSTFCCSQIETLEKSKQYWAAFSRYLYSLELSAFRCCSNLCTSLWPWFIAIFNNKMITVEHFRFFHYFT